jgi:hypothetical protein
VTSTGLLGLAGLEGVPTWLRLVGLGVLAVAALWWGIRVVARGWTAHGPPHRLGRWSGSAGFLPGHVGLGHVVVRQLVAAVVARWSAMAHAERRSERGSPLLFLGAIAFGGAVSLVGMYSLAELSTAVPAIGEGVLMTVALAAMAIGALTTAVLWQKLPRRVVTVASLAGTALGYGLFAASGTWVPGYGIAAALLGIAASAFPQMLAWGVEEIGSSIRRLPTPPKLVDAREALLVLAITVGVSGLLMVASALLPFGPAIAGLGSAGIALLAAVAIWATAPLGRPRHQERTSFREAMGQLVRDPFVLSVGATYLFTAAVIGVFDAFWRLALPAADQGWKPWVSAAFVGGGLVLLAFFLPADLRRAWLERRGRGDAAPEGLLASRPQAPAAWMAAAMLVGPVVAVVATHVTGNVALGIAVAGGQRDAREAVPRGRAGGAQRSGHDEGTRAAGRGRRGLGGLDRLDGAAGRLGGSDASDARGRGRRARGHRRGVRGEQARGAPRGGRGEGPAARVRACPGTAAGAEGARAAHERRPARHSGQRAPGLGPAASGEPAGGRAACAAAGTSCPVRRRLSCPACAWRPRPSSTTRPRSWVSSSVEPSGSRRRTRSWSRPVGTLRCPRSSRSR